jgi:hypothetical protein
MNLLKTLPASLGCLIAFLALASSAALAGDSAPAADVGIFGIGSSNLGTKQHAKWIPQMRAIGIRDLRAPRTSWNMVQPVSETEWTWTELDRQLDYLEAQGIRSGGLFLGTASAWNKLDHERGLPLNKLEAWSEYVYRIVKHAKGRIKYWEIWNEPPNGTRNAPASDYAKVVVATYKAAKRADPDCKIGMAAKSAHITYLEQAILAGAKDHFDYITLHPYEILGCVMAHPGTEPVYLNIAPTLRKMLATQNPAKAGVPIWFTELGYDSRKGEDPQAHALVKAYTMGIVQGITCINWYEGIDGDAGPLGLLRKDGTPRPSYKAMGEMIRLLGLNPSCVGWVLLNDKHYAFVLQGNGRTVLATWAATRKPDTIDFRQPVQLIDPVTGKSTRVSTHELTTAPILIDGVPESIVAQARSNKTKPLPWNGDYSDAGSVSITFGKTNVEKGLHSQSADSIAADVVAYGGNARAGTVPGGNVFMVDPNFLSYAQTPIEITIVVRRNEANDPAKLELEYESTSGYKKAPAFNVPDNHQWHKATWKLTDIQFVSTWAFNFRINTGKYVVQSVTVTKLAR